MMLMSSWIGLLLLYGIPILFVLSGASGIVRGQLGFGRDTAYGWKARVLGVVYIFGGILLFYVLRILSRV